MRKSRVWKPCSSAQLPAELHVVQRAAPPAGEPCPVAVDVVARAVMPTCVEQPVSVATTCLRAFGFVFFCTGATFVTRFFAHFFVRHNYCPFYCCSVLLSPHITRCGSGPPFYVNSYPGKQVPACVGRRLWNSTVARHLESSKLVPALGKPR